MAKVFGVEGLGFGMKPIFTGQWKKKMNTSVKDIETKCHNSSGNSKRLMKNAVRRYDFPERRKAETTYIHAHVLDCFL